MWFPGIKALVCWATVPKYSSRRVHCRGAGSCWQWQTTPKLDVANLMTKAPARIVYAIVVVVLCATLSASQETPAAQRSPTPAAQPSPRAAQEPQGENQTPPLPLTSDPK